MTDIDAILDIEPPVLNFPFELKKQISCSLHLSNLTDVHVAFRVRTTTPRNYCVRPKNGILLPRATCDVVVTMQALRTPPPEMKFSFDAVTMQLLTEIKCKHKFQVQSVIVDQCNASKEFTPDMFLEESGFTVYEKKLNVIYSEPPSQQSSGSYMHENKLNVNYSEQPRPQSPVREESDDESDEEPDEESDEESDEWSSLNAIILDNRYLITSEFGNESKVTSQHEKKSSQGTAMISQQSSQDDSTLDEESQKIDVGLASIFGYEELEEATKFFNRSEVVGEGGFGIVYRGVLRDGRTVAVKDLNVRHPKRIEQFINEVTVLFRIRHPNLVSLYGCTNPGNRKLLLVYEFVANGTVACHLHGGQLSKGSLSWDTRIRIAVETADAISYLHSLERPIIHRDIKTDNILLDSNFTVKVADLGNCRLLPWGAVHVSTMPQGTQGYLDPEYNQCLKLTDKSDVYSFGVVLLELISGKKALDLDRDDDEIWLSRMALNKMKNKAIEQLVDPELGYFSDVKMKSMVDSVTELALRCLRPKGNTRPQMTEVLTTLKRIKDGKIMDHDDTSSLPLAWSDDSLSASNSA